MKRRGFWERLALGAVAGFAGTLALQGLRMASGRLLPGTMPPIRLDPGEFMVKRAEEALGAQVAEAVPKIAEIVAARTLAAGYGMTAGALYAALVPGPRSILVDGAALGLAVWAAGYLGWLPALGLMPAVKEQGRVEALAPAFRHMLYGVATVGAYRWLQDQRPLADRLSYV